MNFFDRNPAGEHVSQFVLCPYIAPIPIQEPSVMTHTGSFLKSTGFNIGDRIAIALMLWKHLSSNSVHWKVQLFCADPDNGVVVKVIIIWGVAPVKGLAKGPGAWLGNANLVQKEI